MALYLGDFRTKANYGRGSCSAEAVAERLPPPDVGAKARWPAGGGAALLRVCSCFVLFVFAQAMAASRMSTLFSSVPLLPVL